MADKKGISKATQELTFPEDASLNYACPLKSEIRRPQGVKTMEEWGAQIFPEGKHAGKSFSVVYVMDPKYRAFMMNHPKLANPWALSFQNYVKAMELKTSSQMPHAPVMNKGSSSQAATGVEKNLSMPWHFEVAGHEWDLAEHYELSPPPKRSLSPEQAETMPMGVTQDLEKEQKLITNIAILQRELDMMRQKTDP